MKKVAVTGDIGAGKSSVCKIFRKLGAYIVDADAIVASLLQEDRAVQLEIIQLLGPSICDEKGGIQKERIAKKVFQNPDQLRALEKILHPYVFSKIDEYYEQAKKSGYKLFVAEIALLFEVNREKDYDFTISVTADKKIIDKRIEKKPIEYEKRRQRQLPSEEKQKRADFVIHNNGSFSELEDQVHSLYQILSR